METRDSGAVANTLAFSTAPLSLIILIIELSEGKELKCYGSYSVLLAAISGQNGPMRMLIPAYRFGAASDVRKRTERLFVTSGVVGSIEMLVLAYRYGFAFDVKKRTEKLVTCMSSESGTTPLPIAVNRKVSVVVAKK